MKPSTYATICSILCGFANCITWTGYYASAFICESVLHSVNGREPGRWVFLCLQLGECTSESAHTMASTVSLCWMRYTCCLLSPFLVYAITSDARFVFGVRERKNKKKPINVLVDSRTERVVLHNILSLIPNTRPISLLCLVCRSRPRILMCVSNYTEIDGRNISVFNVGYSGYLTEFSTRKTIERNQSLSWLVISN